MRISLNAAFFCPNCESVIDSAKLCDCGSSVNLIPLATWIDRAPTPIVAYGSIEDFQKIGRALREMNGKIVILPLDTNGVGRSETFERNKL